jgi:glutathione S-transferase
MSAISETPVVLEKFIPVWGLPDLSPFCVKAEVYLQLAGIPYTTQVGDSRKAPKAKLPVLHDGAQAIADSSAIIEHLERTRGKPLDAFLSPEQVAIATAVKAMLEEQLYFVVAYQRWQEDRGWEVYKPTFRELGAQLGIPAFLFGIVLPQVRRQTVASLRGQGMGRHTPDEVTAIGKRILTSISTLCVGPYFFGKQPCTLDATVYAFVQSILGAPFEGPLKEQLRADEKLVRYCEHVKRACGDRT